MNKLPLSDYNLDMTLLGGQSFAWDFEDGYYYGFTNNKIIKLKHKNNILYWQTYPDNDELEFVRNYLRLDADYKNILKKIQKDRFVKLAIQKYPNLRLLKQDFEQTLLSFIVSSNNNIQSIRKIIRAMNMRFGRQITVNNKTIYLFPETERLANADLNDLLKCKLGFRAKYIKGAAQFLIKSNLKRNIHTLNEIDAKENLLQIKGIGEKITDCILVFSLGFDNITPLDVWAKRALTMFYKLPPKMKYEDMKMWTSKYFNGYAAWAGQFLFEYIRHK